MNLAEALELLTEAPRPIATEVVKGIMALAKNHPSKVDQSELAFVISDMVQQKELKPAELVKLADLLAFIKEFADSAVTGQPNR